MHALFTLAWFTAPLVAQTNTDDLTPLDIAYSTTVSEDLKSLHVGMLIENQPKHVAHGPHPMGASFLRPNDLVR